MQNNTATKLLPIVSDDKKIEVSLSDDLAIIKLSTWVDELGWCGQKTLEVDAEMLDDLHRAITSARYRINKRRSEQNEQTLNSKVIEFPICQ